MFQDRLRPGFAAVILAITLSSPALAQSSAPAERMVAEGVFAIEQAQRGEAVFKQVCSQCHTASQHSGTTFANRWSGRSVFDLFELIRSTMPQDNPDGLSTDEYVSIVAYILKLNGFPPGETPLPAVADHMKQLRIPRKSPQ